MTRSRIAAATAFAACVLLLLGAAGGAQAAVATDAQGFCEDGEPTGCWWYGGMQAKGDVTSITITEAGDYFYHCHSHASMDGTIDVRAAPEGYKAKTVQIRIVEGDSGDPSTWGFTPASPVVSAGDTITFTNTGDVGHDVMMFQDVDGSDHHDGDDGHGDHDHGHDDTATTTDSPAPAMVALPLLAAALVLFGRRRD